MTIRTLDGKAANWTLAQGGSNAVSLTRPGYLDCIAANGEWVAFIDGIRCDLRRVENFSLVPAETYTGPGPAAYVAPVVEPPKPSIIARVRSWWGW